MLRRDNVTRTSRDHVKEGDFILYTGMMDNGHSVVAENERTHKIYCVLFGQMT